MTAANELFIVGLRNAHAMETQAREMMERQSGRLDDYPEVKEKVTQHLAETEGQLKRLDECLRTFGEESSSLKDTAQSMMGNLAAMAHTMLKEARRKELRPDTIARLPPFAPKLRRWV